MRRCCLTQASTCSRSLRAYNSASIAERSIRSQSVPFALSPHGMYWLGTGEVPVGGAIVSLLRWWHPLLRWTGFTHLNERQTCRKLSSCYTSQHATKYALQEKTWHLKPILRLNLTNLLINAIKSWLFLYFKLVYTKSVYCEPVLTNYTLVFDHSLTIWFTVTTRRADKPTP